jgi:hypothetical protein
MTKNVGDVDRFARWLVGLAFLSLPIIMTLPPGLPYIAASVAAVLVGASLIWSGAKGYCFAYGFFGYSTCKK